METEMHARLQIKYIIRYYYFQDYFLEIFYHLKNYYCYFFKMCYEQFLNGNNEKKELLRNY